MRRPIGKQIILVMVKVSVILPVYGVAQYIEKCTQSLLDQTLQEMEFIYVDDHGPLRSVMVWRALMWSWRRLAARTGF